MNAGAASVRPRLRRDDLRSAEETTAGSTTRLREPLSETQPGVAVLHGFFEIVGY